MNTQKAREQAMPKQMPIINAGPVSKPPKVGRDMVKKSNTIQLPRTSAMD